MNAKYGYTMNITEKSDVYSYRVVLLEILSGRSAIKSQVGDGVHIVEWVKKKMGSFEPAVSILDLKLQGLPDQMVQEMLQTLGIAMFCVNSSPAERPTMKEVVALLMEVKIPNIGRGVVFVGNERTGTTDIMVGRDCLENTKKPRQFGDA
ncbi:hypothetical protein RJ639_004777 [Escallonia herrerae]|uniref:Uncharacterized protein n=1 Tax=Escallonia herrerae TaxID=1293975 RepID=A0AA89AX73_9ASTE|nr:hypothetical protein RJ639_004777 [Escallonia herrerae]